MKKLLRAIVPALAVLVLSSCTTTNLVQTWRDPNYRSAPVKRIFVIGVMPNDMYRVQFENGLAQALLSRVFEAATSASAFPPGQLDKQKVQQYVVENGVDLVVVQRLTKKTIEEYVPPSVAVRAGRPAYGGWYGDLRLRGTARSTTRLHDRADQRARRDQRLLHPQQPEVPGVERPVVHLQRAGRASAAQSLSSQLVAALIKAQILVK